MYTAALKDMQMIEGWSEEDPSMRARATYPVFHGTGAKSTAVVYFELEPGDCMGTHTDTAEEVMLILEGQAEATVDGETVKLGPYELSVVPALATHNVRNVGEGTLRGLGFWPSNVVVSVFEHTWQPFGERVVPTPLPEV